MAPQMPDGRIAKRIGGHSADHFATVAKVRETNSNIRLGSANVNVEARVLKQKFTTRRSQP
jgi:hypothetical protein